MDLEIREKHQELKEIIDSVQGVLLTLHPFPDLDSLGSVLALADYLKSIDKEVLVLEGQTPLPERFKIIPGAENIIPGDLQDKHLENYDLLIALDQSSVDRVTIKNWELVGKNLKTVNIDHHISNESFADFDLICSDYASTAEIVAELLQLWGYKFNQQSALFILLAIHDDTGGFSFGNLRPDTFSLAAELFSLCPNFIDILSKLRASKESGHLKLLSLALGNIKTCLGDKIAYTTISTKNLKDNDLEVYHFENQEISNLLISVKDWPLGITLFEKEAGHISISCRSHNKEWDVSLLARQLGGGGHSQAAGALVKGSIKEVEEKLLIVVKDLYSHLL